jgi:DNA polymerase I
LINITRKYYWFLGCVELWSRERGLERISAAYPPSFYMHLKDPQAHWEMIQALETRFRVEECSFNSIFGTFKGHRIYANRKIAEKIEIQTRYAAELYNVDIR